MGAGTSTLDKKGLRHFNWDLPCFLVDDFVIDKDTLVCAVLTEYMDKSMRFTSISQGCGLMCQISQQCIVSGMDIYCLYRGFEIMFCCYWSSGGGGEKVVILSKHCLSALQQPLIITNLKSRALLLAMNLYVRKTGHKILLFNNKVMLRRYWDVLQGVGDGCGGGPAS